MAGPAAEVAAAAVDAIASAYPATVVANDFPDAVAGLLQVEGLGEEYAKGLAQAYSDEKARMMALESKLDTTLYAMRWRSCQLPTRLSLTPPLNQPSENTLALQNISVYL